MCGFLFLADGKNVAPDGRVEEALARMHVRGPDHQALEYGAGFAIGAARLAIIGPGEEANQPFWSASRRHVLVYNGAIYNYREIRTELEQRGIKFRTASDTEVLLESLLAFGLEETLTRIRGMFAFLLYDTLTGKFAGARDHFGQKPFYYFHDSGRFAAASDMAALNVLRGSTAPDLDAYHVYLCSRGTSGTRGLPRTEGTFFAGLRALPAGHRLTGTSENIIVTRFFAPWSLFNGGRYQASKSLTKDAAMDRVADRLKEAVRRHLVSDVPVGILLSGGIDSSLVYWYARAFKEQLTAFTKLSPGIEEIPLAVVPKLMELRPSVVHYATQSRGAYLPQLVDFVRASSAPSRWGSGPPMHDLCAEARRNGVLVLLGGDCSDEYFAGYEHYESYFAEPDPDLMDVGDFLAVDRNSPFYDAKRSGAYEEEQRQVRAAILEHLDGAVPVAEKRAHATLLQDSSYFLQNTALPHSDAYSMAASVELRTPLLDLDLVRYGMNLPLSMRASRGADGQFGKTVLRALAVREIGSFIGRRKEGTRNYATKFARAEQWRWENFRIGELFEIPVAKLTRGDVIRLSNLEIFHRLHISGDSAVLEDIFIGDRTEAAAEAQA